MKQRLHKKFAETGIPLTEKQLERFCIYQRELLSWNRRTNLISKHDEDRILERHFLESASLSFFEMFQGNVNVIDIGTGAGFPGLPLKIVQPEMSLTLLESKRMKALFLKDVTRKMDLPNVTIVWERAENTGNDPAFRHKFDVAVSRAVAELSELYELSSALLTSDGTLVAIKGSNLDAEVAALEKLYPGLSVSTHALSGTSSARNQVVVFVSKAPLHTSRVTV